MYCRQKKTSHRYTFLFDKLFKKRMNVNIISIDCYSSNTRSNENR